MSRSRARIALLVGVLVVSAAAFTVLYGMWPPRYDYHLGQLNSFRESRGDAAGDICVNDTYDENHCRKGRPLILPAEPLRPGDCVEIRTLAGSDEISVRGANDAACDAVSYSGGG